MAQIFRVERTKNFTVMSNHHFKNKNLTLKAKGLLSLMLSLPDDWNYNMQGLTTLSRDGIDSVRSAIKELEHQSLKYQAEQNRKIAEKEVQKLKKRIKLQSEKINEIKFFCGIGYIVALVLSVCLIKMCFLCF